MQVLTNLHQVHAAVRSDCIGEQCLLCRSFAYAVLLTIRHSVVGGNEDRHVVPRLAGQEGVDGPEVPFTSGTTDGFIHIAATAVIGCNDEIPIVVYGIHTA